MSKKVKLVILIGAVCLSLLQFQLTVCSSCFRELFGLDSSDYIVETKVIRWEIQGYAASFNGSRPTFFSWNRSSLPV